MLDGAIEINCVPVHDGGRNEAQARGSEETLALFDLLSKPNLQKNEIDRIKKVAVELLVVLKRKKQEIDDWRAKEQTRDDMRAAIHDVLFNERTGLPESYDVDEIAAKTDAVFEHAYHAYA
jgi:type I restriction enzyme R subunit